MTSAFTRSGCGSGDKTPLGLEQLYSDYTLLLPERTLLTNLVPNRDVGIQAQGDLAGGLVTYVAAVFNGIPDATNGDVDTDTAKDFAGRVTVRPFNRAKNPALRALARSRDHVGCRRDRCRRIAARRSRRSSRTRQTRSRRHAHARLAGRLLLLSRSARLPICHNTQAVRLSAVAADLTHTAWEVTGAMSSPASPTERGVIPAKPFDPAHDGARCRSSHGTAASTSIRRVHAGPRHGVKPTASDRRSCAS